jgi:hypothetical protein
MKLHCLQEILPSDPVEQGDEGDWDTVGEPAGGSRGPAPTVEELVAQLTRLLRRKRKRLPSLDWPTSPASSALQP